MSFPCSFAPNQPPTAARRRPAGLVCCPHVQGMGENVLAAVQEFTHVLASGPRAPEPTDAGGSVYFDLWGRAMVRPGGGAAVQLAHTATRTASSYSAQLRFQKLHLQNAWPAPPSPLPLDCVTSSPLAPLPSPSTPQVVYSHAQAKALHHAPLVIVLLLPLLASADDAQQLTWGGLARATALAAASLVCALNVPAALGAGRALASGGAARLRALRCPGGGRNGASTPVVAPPTHLPSTLCLVFSPYTTHWQACRCPGMAALLSPTPLSCQPLRPACWRRMCCSPRRAAAPAAPAPRGAAAAARCCLRPSARR